jgi:aspartate/methionine/tyrosine aminotransferase
MESTTELDSHVALYKRNRTRLLDGLTRAGITTIAPADGAFYLYADVSRFGSASRMAEKLLDEAGVAATPGLDFDPQEGDAWLRLSYAGSETEVAAAADAFAKWCTAQTR